MDLPSSVFTDCVAPVIARSLGARRAGQGRDSGERSEQTLDAPKRSRTIGHRSDGKVGALTAPIEAQTPLASRRSGLRRPAEGSGFARGTAPAPLATQVRSVAHSRIEP